MKANKRKKLEAAGWRVGNTDDLLALTPQESTYISMKLALSETLRVERRKLNLSQVDVARIILSSQSRVAKMEAADPSVSIDLLLKSLLALGISRHELAQAMDT